MIPKMEEKVSMITILLFGIVASLVWIVLLNDNAEEKEPCTENNNYHIGMVIDNETICMLKELEDWDCEQIRRWYLNKDFQTEYEKEELMTEYLDRCYPEEEN